jgi:hypothetical protein
MGSPDEYLQAHLADSHRLTLTVAHYPTGASKWNPIEHRLFSEISKNWAGDPLDSYQKILHFIRSTRTQTGLSVTAHLDRRHYPTGTEPTPEQLHSLRIKPHEPCPSGTTLSHPICKVVLASTLS